MALRQLSGSQRSSTSWKPSPDAPTSALAGRGCFTPSMGMFIKALLQQTNKLNQWEARARYKPKGYLC